MKNHTVQNEGKQEEGKAGKPYRSVPGKPPKKVEQGGKPKGQAREEGNDGRSRSGKAVELGEWKRETVKIVTGKPTET